MCASRRVLDFFDCGRCRPWRAALVPRLASERTKARGGRPQIVLLARPGRRCGRACYVRPSGRCRTRFHNLCVTCGPQRDRRGPPRQSGQNPATSRVRPGPAGARGQMQVSDGNQVWIRVADHLRTQVTEAVWMSTFSDVRPIKVDDRQLTVSVPSNQARERIMNRWLLIVNEALADAAGNGCQLVVLVDPNQEPTEQDQAIGWSDWHDGAAADDVDGHDTVPVRGGFGASSVLDEAGLNPRYTFETFVKGGSNQFALAAALRVAETPGRGRTTRCSSTASAGLGKTHLLHAIGHYVHHNYQHHDVRYVSTENVPQRVRRRHPHQDQHRLPASLPRRRRPADRRHPVPREARRPPGGVLPHVQRPPRRQQADRDLVATASPTPSRRWRNG